MAACVMSSVLAAGATSSLVSSSSSATRTSASYNALLSSRRGSFKTGVAVPAARSAAFRAGNSSQPEILPRIGVRVCVVLCI